jgi:hypothetical protein
VFTYCDFSLNPTIPRPSTSRLSHDRIVYEAYLKSPVAFTLTNRCPGVRTNIQSLSCADISVIHNRCVLLIDTSASYLSDSADSQEPKIK